MSSRPTLKQDVPAAVVNSLAKFIRDRFCKEVPRDVWYSSHYHFIKKNVVMWPAKFMVDHNFTVSGDRYKEIVMAILVDADAHRAENVKYWPGYLMKCVQSHFQNHWEEYNNEAKSVSAKTDAAVLAGKRAINPNAGDNTVSTIAMAHKVLSSATRQRQAKVSQSQGELF